MRTTIAPSIVGVFSLIYCAHIGAACCGRKPYTACTWVMLAIANTCFIFVHVTVVLALLVVTVAHEERIQDTMDELNAYVNINVVRWLPIGGLAFVFLPFIPGMPVFKFLGKKTLEGMARGLVPFFVVLPTVTTGLVAYSIS